MTEDRVPTCPRCGVTTADTGYYEDGQKCHDPAMTENRVPTAEARFRHALQTTVAEVMPSLAASLERALDEVIAEQPAPPLDVPAALRKILTDHGYQMEDTGEWWAKSAGDWIMRDVADLLARLGSAPSRSDPEPPVQVDRDFTNPDGTPGRYR